jgi:hypothetical protein
MKSIEKEKQTVSEMIHLYCRHKEKNAELCVKCRELEEYALTRLSHCPFGIKKTSCRKCTVHCYNPEMRKRIRQVMRYAGPRMLFYHPIAVLRHTFLSKRPDVRK